MRDDISKALTEVPPHICADLEGPASESLQLLAEWLPADEQVELLSSGAPKWMGMTTSPCTLALTERRLLFVAASPQVLSWRLPTVTKFQALNGTAGSIVALMVEDTAGSSYQLGIDGGWGRSVESAVKTAIARAILRQG